MNDPSKEELQYNSCISRGICSINPRISAMQTVIVLYLKIFAKLALNIEIDKKTKNFLLNTISITIYNPEFNEKSFIQAIDFFRKAFNEIFKNQNNKTENIYSEKANLDKLFKNTNNIIQSIKYGEKIFNKSIKIFSNEIRDLYNIILIIVKNLSINLLELESYNKDDNEIFSLILNLLNEINLEKPTVENLKNKIINAAKKDCQLVATIRNTQENLYGKQAIKEVSFSTTPNKAILVVGSNIKELEIILEALKEENIDVYTHDEMILAHTFPAFWKYPNLKGHFGQGLENCLIDFANFPGPIILTKNSLHNIENFYRGLLFTTDYTTSPKGIIKINNYDFSEVIESAKSSKGFKKGKECKNETIGYNYDDICSYIKQKFDNSLYEKIVLIGAEDFSSEQKKYFENLIKLYSEKTLIISFSYNKKKENLIYINTCNDYYSLMKIFNFIKDFNIPISIFIPNCNRNSISQIISLAENKKTEIFLDKCKPILLNPSLIKTLEHIFNIKDFDKYKKNLKEFFKDK